jgi:hypothetical protein
VNALQGQQGLTLALIALDAAISIRLNIVNKFISILNHACFYSGGFITRSAIKSIVN